MTTTDPSEPRGQRLDRWLWSARFFKTRSLAVEAVNGGRVTVNGVRAKPAKAVRPGDRLYIHRPPAACEVIVRALCERRVSARLAADLYAETAESIAARAVLAERRAIEPPLRTLHGDKPDKKARRQRNRLKRGLE